MFFLLSSFAYMCAAQLEEMHASKAALGKACRPAPVPSFLFSFPCGCAARAGGLVQVRAWPGAAQRRSGGTHSRRLPRCAALTLLPSCMWPSCTAGWALALARPWSQTARHTPLTPFPHPSFPRRPTHTHTHTRHSPSRPAVNSGAGGQARGLPVRGAEKPGAAGAAGGWQLAGRGH